MQFSMLVSKHKRTFVSPIYLPEHFPRSRLLETPFCPPSAIKKKLHSCNMRILKYLWKGCQFKGITYTSTKKSKDKYKIKDITAHRYFRISLGGDKNKWGK